MTLQVLAGLCGLAPVPTVLIEWCVRRPVAQTMESASNVEQWCETNRIGRCFAAKQGVTSVPRSIVQHHVRKLTAIQSGAGVLNSQRNSYAREQGRTLLCDFPDENGQAKIACEVRLAPGSNVLASTRRSLEDN